jgi:glycosyltransferase involved in cell wall biosynthesis
MSSNKICCIFNIAPHYNSPIYSQMDRELNCDFYFGDKLPYPIQLMNYESMRGFKNRLKNIYIFGNFYWQIGVGSLVFKPYKYYILTGEPYCISVWYILLMNRISGRKTYLWTHGWYGNESGLKKVIKKIFFKLSNRILLYGDYARDLMINEGFNPNKLVTVFNSLDFDQQVLVRKSLTLSKMYNQHFSNDYPVLLYVGRIEARKKIELLIEALNELHLTNLPCNLVLIGKPSAESNVSELISKFKLNDFVWNYGPCFDESLLGELIYNADLCVVPGDVGLTVMHCFVYGLPVVTHNNFPKHGPEFEAIMPNISGDFFEEDSLEKLCHKIKTWINIDSIKRNEIRENCFKIVEGKYNPTIQISILKNIFISK